jgi:uncharacterized protein YigE (DUF2233 family)
MWAMPATRRLFLGSLAAIGTGAALGTFGARRGRAGAPATGATGVTVSTVTFGGVTIDRVRVDLARARLGLYWRRPDGTRFGSLRAVDAWLRERGERPVALTNAGIFGTDAPVGLHLAAGVVEHPLERSAGAGNFYLLPNGVFQVGAAGAAVVETSRFDARGVQLATQSGPLLLARGAIHPAFQPDSHSALIRSGVGVRSPHELWLAVTRGPITFYDFARFFRDALGCPDALFLDGTISRLWAPGAGRREDHGFMGILAAFG